MSLAWPMLAAVGAAGATWLYEWSKFLHGALLSDKKRQTAASPSAALTAYFALFLHSAHAGDFAPAGATKGLSGRPLETFGAATFGV